MNFDIVLFKSNQKSIPDELQKIVKVLDKKKTFQNKKDLPLNF